MNKIKEDLKAKEAIKEAEQRKRGSFIIIALVTFYSPLILR